MSTGEGVRGTVGAAMVDPVMWYDVTYVSLSVVVMVMVMVEDGKQDVLSCAENKTPICTYIAPGQNGNISNAGTRAAQPGTLATKKHISFHFSYRPHRSHFLVAIIITISSWPTYQRTHAFATSMFMRYQHQKSTKRP